MLKRLFFLWLLFSVGVRAAPGLQEAALRPEADYREIAGRFAAHFPRTHLARIPINDAVAARTWTNYLAALDYDRSYFLQPDIDRFAAYRATIDDQLKDGDTGFAYQVFQVFKERLRNRCAAVAESPREAQELKQAIDEALLEIHQ